MQFSILATLGLSALALAAPAEKLTARGDETVCCPKGKKSGCSVVPAGSSPPADTDVYGNCLTVGLINVVLCNILDDLTLDVPITVSVLDS